MTTYYVNPSSLGATTFVPSEDPIYVPSSEAQAWCTVTHPQPAAGCKPTEGLAKPTTATALAKFKEVQFQLNRIAAVKGYAKIGVDGVIGSKTVALYNKAMGKSVNSLDVFAGAILAAGSGVIQSVRMAADSARAPATTSSPPSKYRTPTINANGSIDSSQGPLSFVPDILWSPLGLVAVGGIGFFTFKMLTSKKKPLTAARSAPASNPARRKRARARRRR